MFVKIGGIVLISLKIFDMFSFDGWFIAVWSLDIEPQEGAVGPLV